MPQKFYHASPRRFRHGDILTGHRPGGYGSNHPNVCMTTDPMPHATIRSVIPGWPDYHPGWDVTKDAPRDPSDANWTIYEVEPLYPPMFVPENHEYQTRAAKVIRAVGPAKAFLQRYYKDVHDRSESFKLGKPEVVVEKPEDQRQRKEKLQDRLDRRQKRRELEWDPDDEEDPTDTRTDARRAHRVAMSHRVAVTWLNREPTDSVADITFRVKLGSDTWIYASLPRLGNVGFLKLEDVDLEDPEYWEDNLEERQMVSNELQALNLKLHVPKLGVFGAANTWVDRRFRAEGVAERLYLIGIAWAARHDHVVCPNYVYGGSGATSGDAKRVWTKLFRQIPHEGDFVWGGGLNLENLLTQPLRPRRGHGFGQSKPNVPPREDD